MSIVSNNPEYSIVIYKRAPTTLAYGDRLLEVNNPKNIGWARYLNDVPEAFFSLYQEDEQVKILREWEGQAHIRFYRIDPITGERACVWSGIFGTETNEEGTDIIFYSHGYLAAAYWMVTSWQQTWNNIDLGFLMTTMWNRVKTDYHVNPPWGPGSELNFVATGTIQSPVTTSGGSTAIVLPMYVTYLKPVLNVMREITSIARSDTTNVVVFEITPGETPTFNYWKNKGVDTNVVYTYGSVEVADFWLAGLEAHRRNQIIGVGTSPRDLILNSDQYDPNVGLRGRRVTPIYFQWVRDQSELDRISKLRLARANIDHFKLGLIFHPGGCIPPGMSYSPWDMGDRVRVRIDRGNTLIDELRIIVGAQVLYQHGEETVTLITESRTGS